MKATFQHADLSAALGRAMRATGKTSGFLPILSHVAIITDGLDTVELVGSDSRQRITATCRANVAQSGSIALDGGLLAAFLGSCKGDEVTLAVDGTIATVKAGRARAKIHGLDTQDMPSWPSATDGATLTLDAAELRRAITMTALAAAKDDSRPVLAGVHLERVDDVLTLASVDGFRLSRVSLPVVDSHYLDFAATIPAVSLRTLAGLLPDAGTVGLTITERQAHARLDGAEWASVLIDGTFPDVAQIIPREFAYGHAVERKPLLAALKAAAPFTKDNNDRVELAYLPDDGALEVVGISSAAGSLTFTVDADGGASGMPRTGLNAQYLADVLGALDSAEVTLSGNGQTQALVVRGVGRADFDHVIMPMVTSS